MEIPLFTIMQAYMSKDLAQELLLGAGFLRMDNCVINFEQETIRIGDRAYMLASTISRKIYHVAVGFSVTLPLRCMAKVRCNVEEASVIGKTTGILEAETRFEERYALGIIKVVATVNKDWILVRVFNPQSTPVRIYKGSTIWKLCPLLETDQEGKSEDTIP